MKSGKEIKLLLQKFILNQCSPEEIEIVVAYFKEQRATAEFPTVEEVLELLEETPQLEKTTSEKLYLNIQLQISRKNYSNQFFIKKIYKYVVAACFIGFLVAGYFNRDFLGFPKSESQDFQHNNFITLQLENGEVEYISEDDSTLVKDGNGLVLGTQQGGQLEYSGKTTSAEKYNTLKVPYGKRFELSLSDGTRVFLNAGTSLKYPVNFLEGKKREVFLKGEAFFDVAKDSLHPFIVNTKKAKVQVLGTKFNVDSYENQTATSVVLVEGSVLAENKHHDYIKMIPNEKVEISSTGMRKKTVIAKNFASWKDGFLTLNEMPVKQIIPLIERYYNIEIYSEKPIDLNKKTSSGKIYLSKSIPNVIETLSLITNNTFHYQQK